MRACCGAWACAIRGRSNWSPCDTRRSRGPIVKLIVLLPLADIGVILGWVPYRLAGLVAERNAESDDVLGTVKLLSGVVFIGGAWIAESIVVGVLFGWMWLVPAFAVAALTGYIALRYGELADGVLEWTRALWLRTFRGDSIGRLTARRRQLAGEVADALVIRAEEGARWD